MSHQRREERKKLVAFTPVYELLHKTILGYVGDLTLQGAMVVGERPIEVDKQMTIGIEVSNDTPGAPPTRFAVIARVAWCRQDESPQYHNIGLEFVNLTPQQTETLQAIIERYQFRRDST